jgi:hypothetical protein
MRRIEAEPAHVHDLVGQEKIVGEPEVLSQMRLQPGTRANCARWLTSKGPARLAITVRDQRAIVVRRESCQEYVLDLLGGHRTLPRNKPSKRGYPVARVASRGPI